VSETRGRRRPIRLAMNGLPGYTAVEQWVINIDGSHEAGLVSFAVLCRLPLVFTVNSFIVIECLKNEHMYLLYIHIVFIAVR